LSFKVLVENQKIPRAKLCITIAFLCLSASIFADTNVACKDVDQAFSVRGDSSYPDNLEKFMADGGDPFSIIHVNSVGSILNNFDEAFFPDGFVYNNESRYEYGYKFSLSTACELNVSKYKYKERKIPDKDVHHHLVAKGDAVYSAGAIHFFHGDSSVEKIILVNRSGRFCPSLESLDVVQDYLVSLGIDRDRIEIIEGARKDCK